MTDTQLYAEELSISVLRNAQEYYGINDRSEPEIILLKPLEFERGANPDWAEYFRIIDDTDGEIKIARTEVFVSDSTIDFSESGEYGFGIIARDKAGNENRSNFAAIVK